MIQRFKRVLFGSRLRCEECGERLDSDNEITVPITGMCDDCRPSSRVIYDDYDHDAEEGILVSRYGDQIEVRTWDADTLKPTSEYTHAWEHLEPDVVYDLEQDVVVSDLEECERCGYETTETNQLDIIPNSDEPYCIKCLEAMDDLSRTLLILSTAFQDPEVNDR